MKFTRIRNLLRTMLYGNTQTGPVMWIPDKTLNQFYLDYQSWLDNGATGPEFYREYGLCRNLASYKADTIFIRTNPINAEALRNLRRQLKTTFRDSTYPFNGDEGAADYLMEIGTESAYENPRRRKWVRDMVVLIKQKGLGI